MRTATRHALLVAAVAVVAVPLGIATAILGTEAGRAVVVTTALSSVNEAIPGEVAVDSVRGSPWRGMQVMGIRVRTPEGARVVEVRSLELRYGLSDLLSGRVVLGRLAVRDVEVELVQPTSGAPFTLAAAFAATDTGASDAGARPPLLAFRNVSLENVTVTIRTPAGPADTAVLVEDGLRVRRIGPITAELPYMRVSDPAAPDGPMLFEFAALSVPVSDPDLAIVDLEGRAALWGDSVTLDLPRAELQGTTAELAGAIFWPGGPVQLALEGRATAFHTDDLRGLTPALPAGLAGTGVVRLTSLSADELLVDADSLDLEGVGGGGRVRGRLGLRLGPADAWAQRETDLALERFDLEYVRHLLDTLPVAGRLTGRVRADGPATALRLDVDAAFRDSLVPGWPWTEVRGAGVVAVGGDDQFVFRDFELAHADIALPTVTRLIPAILLKGRLTGTGVVSGPWLEVGYEGTLRHADAPLPASEARGTFRIDATGETVGVWAALAFDSLRLAGLESTFPTTPLLGSVAGPVEVAGYLDSLEVAADVAGDAGWVRARGPLFFADDSLGAHRLDLVLRRFDVSGVRPGAPPTTIDGAGHLAGWWRDSTAFALETVFEAGPSELRGAPVDTLRAAVGWQADAVRVDSLRIDGFRWQLDAQGRLGTRVDVDHRLQFVLSSDSLGVLEPWVAALLDRGAPEDSMPPSGTVRVAGTVTGTPTTPGIIADVALDGIRRGPLYVDRAGGSIAYAGESRIVNGTVRVDSASVGRVHLAALDVRVHGRPDSLGWEGGTRVWGAGDIAGRGVWQQRADTMTLGLDSLVADLTRGVWRVGGAVARWSPDGLILDGFEAVNDSGVGRVQAAGRLPFRGPGDFAASVESAALEDVWLLLGRDPGTVSGSLGGTFRVAGTAREPVIDGQVGVRNATVGASALPQVTAVLHYEDRRLTGTAEARRMGVPILTLEVGVPLDLAIGDVAQRRLPGSLLLRARADSVDLALLNTITPQVRRAAGTFDADVAVQGTWEAPELAGFVTVRDAMAEFPTLGVRHEDVYGRLRLAGDTVHVDTLHVRSGRGTAGATGYVRLEELSRPLVNLRVVANDFRIMDVRDVLTLAASGDVGLSGPAIGATLRGQATVTRGVLYFADLITKEIVDLDNPLFRDFVDTTQLREEGLATALEVLLLDSLRIDSLEVVMSRDTWLRSREANIQLAGSLTVDRAGDAFSLNGTLQTPRGSYRLDLMPAFTREFTVTGGQVRYLGTQDLNAVLDIDAQHVVRPRRGDPVTVSVHIGGTVYEPELQLASDVSPPLSDTEIISYLLFGAPSVQSRQDWLTAESVAEELVGTVTGQLGTMLISDWGVPLDYAQIRPASGGEGLGVEGDFGKQFNVFGRPAFLTATPLVCNRQTTQFDLGASLEYQLSRRWLVAASIDPARRCRSFATETTLRYQFGVDIVWEIAY